MADTAYKKLPGKGLRTQGLFSVTRGYSSLWLGENHLLQVDSLSGYVEEYKRFYFRDIQAIIVRKTRKGFAWNMIFGALALLFFFIGIGVTNNVGSAILYSLAGIFVLLLFINTARGPTSSGHLKTAVQIEQLPSFNRLRNARKSVALLRPLLEQAQGTLLAEELLQHFAPAPPQLPSDPTIQAAGPTFRSPPPLIRPYQSTIHLKFFAALLLSGLIEIAHLYFHNAGFLAFEMLFSLVVVILGIAALAKQHGTDLGKPLRTVTWASAIYLGILMCVGYAQMLAMGISDPDTAGDQWSMIKRYSEFAPLETPWLLALLITNCAIASGLGLAGLFLFGNWQRAKAAAVPPPPPIPASQSAER